MVKRLVAFATIITASITLFGTGCILIVPLFDDDRNTCRTKQFEAKAHLKSLFILQENYRLEFGTYGRSMAEIQFVPKTKKTRYRYAISSASKDQFEATATARENDLNGDTFKITERGDLTNSVRGCE